MAIYKFPTWHHNNWFFRVKLLSGEGDSRLSHPARNYEGNFTFPRHICAGAERLTFTRARNLGSSVLCTGARRKGYLKANLGVAKKFKTRA